MGTLEMSHIDLDSTIEVELEEESVCFSDADEGSCYSQFYSTADGDDDDDYCGSEILENECLELRRVSSVSYASDCSVDIESGENKECLVRVDRDCRICQMSLVSSSPGCGVAIELGCCCKDDLAAAHKHCAETWFRIKGNKTCEICNSIAHNVVGPVDIEVAPQANENTAIAVTTPSPAQAPSATGTRRCLKGHRFLNFLLACMVFAFVVSWLFHFKITTF